ncbi:MAG TPA: iron-containing alcohol dehydrogenase [Aestuariivirgaceae bacterium]|nr:iron-containing alcohol dehydrogenase [Aestuariivirgaceae bacterium]
MQSFSLSAVPEIAFGVGRLAELGDRAAAVAGSGAVMLIADPALSGQGITARARASLEDKGLRVGLFDRFTGEPKAADIDVAGQEARAAGATCIVGLGGGSALDTAKVVAAVAVSGLSAEAYALAATALPNDTLPIIAIPTTAGTGSEATRTSVFTDHRKAKVWAWGDVLKPRLAILDPALTTGVPAAVTAATGLDALVHAIEAATNRNRNPAVELYCHRAIGLIAAHLERAVADGGDLEARSALLLGSCYAGIAIDNCGTALAHNISHALAALAPVPHGRATGLAMLATMDWVLDGARDAFAAVATAMGEGAEAEQAVAAFDRLVRRSGMKVSLEGDGLDLGRADLLAAAMAAPENAPMRNSTQRTVSDADLLMLAERVYALR